MDKEEFTSNDFKFSESSVIRYSRGSGSGSGSGRRSRSRSATEFNWKHYCPDVFRKLQQFADIDYDEYMMSVCEQDTLREVCGTKKAGVVIIRGDGDKFIIKTLRKSEIKVLHRMLPKYYEYIRQYRSNSLLIKLFGLHTIKPAGGSKVYFAVMSNVLLSDLQIHGVYDLKGSQQGRDPNKEIVNEKTIKKDVDLEYCFHLHPSIYHKIMEQLKVDCEFLENAQIMDYSLMVSLHFEATQTGADSRSGEQDNLSKREEAESDGGKLGRRVLARAVRIGKEEEWEKVYLTMGIVDIYQSFNMVKRLEFCYKSLHLDPNSISSVNAKAYASRFLDFLTTKVFAPDTSHH